MLKLSKRLKTIEQMVTTDYDHIWDCCCDHGFLGASLLAKTKAKNIHFVDIVPALINTLTDKLARFHSNKTSLWQTHCIDVAQLPLGQYHGKHLVIIAGVGGDLMIQFIRRIHKKHPHLAIDFLLCPVHHQYALRHSLISLDFSLIDEALVEENNRYYEVIFVTSVEHKHQQISIIGKRIWQPKTAEQTLIAKNYLSKTLKHYSKIQQGKSNDVSAIISLYQAVAL